MRILVVEDDPTISMLIEAILEQNNYAIDFATDGQLGLDLSAAYEYDAILLDLTLPKKDGITVCQQIRATGSSVPILLLTALDSPADRARGLDAGADDYLGKPFDADELLARIRALLRRSHQQSTPILSWGNLQLDPASTTVTYDDKPVSVTAKEYALLELFLRNHKRVFSCDAILDHLWSYGETPSEEAIRTHIKGLRHKLKAAGAAADAIETVYGIGYRLKPLNTPEANVITDTWAQFKDQILDRVSELERLAIEIAKGNLQPDSLGQGLSIAHSLSGSLGMFGFSLSSELARQIERLLTGNPNPTLEQGQWLSSSVAALKQELNHPISPPDFYYSDTDLAIDILLISGTNELNRTVETIASDRHWQFRKIDTISGAKSLLQFERVRCILLAPDLASHTSEVLQLLLDIGKHIPTIPVIFPTDLPILDPAIARLGNCLKSSTNPTDIVVTVQREIERAEAAQTHILIVDDDLKILAILRALLMPWGFRVSTLADPQQFWDTFNVARPDLLILDIEMPELSGLDLCKSIRAQTDRSQLPIIFLTAHTEPNLIRDVFAIGADDFATKPVVGAEIVARITNLTKHQHSQRFRTADVTRTRALEHQPIDPDRANLFETEKIRTELIEIDRDLKAENERHTRKIESISERIDLLRQMLNDRD
jgi:DNA-binding response OmpR family regulator/HPt (histidine-containing phosphotransfer) domain-containing protein